MQRISELQGEINRAIPHLLQYQNGISAMKAQIEGSKMDLRNIISTFKRCSTQVQNQMRKKLSNLSLKIDSQNLTDMTRQYEEERRKTERQRRSLESITHLINQYMYGEGTTSSDALSVDDMVDSDAVFKTALKEAIKRSVRRAQKMPISGLSEANSNPRNLRKPKRPRQKKSRASQAPKRKPKRQKKRPNKKTKREEPSSRL